MRRWLPYPTLTLFALATWLILNQSLAPGHLLLGAGLGLALGIGFRRLQPPPLPAIPRAGSRWPRRRPRRAIAGG